MLARIEFSSPTQPNRRSFNFINRTLTATAFVVTYTVCFLLWVGYRWIAQPAWIESLPRFGIELFDLFEFGTTVTVLLLWGVWGWRQYQARVAPKRRRPLTLEQLFALSPQAFEHYVAGLFRQKGYTVTVRGRSGDAGVDLELVRDNGKKAIVQCKRYKNSVGPEIVRELYGTMLHEKVARAFLVTTAEISQSSRRWAQGKPITLIDGQTLISLSRN